LTAHAIACRLTPRACGAPGTGHLGSAAFSIKAFGADAFLTRLNLLVAPTLVLTTLGFPSTGEIWIRIVGVWAVVVGYYRRVCGGANASAFFKAALVGRTIGFALPIVLIFTADAPWQLARLAVADPVGAAWTTAATKAEDSGARVQPCRPGVPTPAPVSLQP
jgi:hypothetical protein